MTYPCSHPRTPENSYANPQRCRTCELARAKARLAQKPYKCGHEKTEANTGWQGKRKRCRLCYSTHERLGVA